MLSDKKICIVGLGLIGGSMGLSLKSKFGSVELIGVDNSTDHCVKALDRGICDRIENLEDAILESDIILVAIPVNHILKLLPHILNLIPVNSTVIDIGSTKGAICQLVKDHKNRKQFVACHPLAGTENSGPEAAFSTLFEQKRNIICDHQLSSKDALKSAEYIMEAVGMQNIQMDAGVHDKHIAYVSHLSHISSFMLGSAVMEIEDDRKQIYHLAGTGFESTVRLAKSSPDMWAPIFEQNKEHVSAALKAYINKLEFFRKMIELNNWEEIRQLMQEANAIRPILNGLFQEVKV